jgi:protoheme IX farnesyltransferase
VPANATSALPNRAEKGRQPATNCPSPGPNLPFAISLVAVPLTASSPAIDEQAQARARSTLLADYATLFKLRVSTMVVITAAAGFYLGSLRSGISPFHIGLVEAMLGIAIVTAGSSVLNQALERNTDLLMPRTASRPMAQRRISLAHGLIVGFLAVFAGSLYLARVTNPLTGTLTLLTAVGYVAIYTPLKRFTTLNTFIGAFPGALPPLIGWTAVRGVIEWPAVALFAILFVWQFPHFMAIGWMYRTDYAAAGIRVTSTQTDTRDAARSSVVQSLFYAVLMIPVSLWLTFLHVTGLPYAIVATVLGLWYLYATIRFAGILRNPEARPLARNLLKVSVMYLPLLMLAMILNAQGRLLF